MNAGALASFESSPDAPDDRTPPKGASSSLFFMTQMDKASAFIARVRAVLADDGPGCEAGFYVQPRVQGASCHFEINLYADDPLAAGRMDALRARLTRACADAGAYFSRPYGDATAIAFAENPLLTSYLKEVKAMFDPNRILAPGRLWDAAPSTPAEH